MTPESTGTIPLVDLEPEKATEKPKKNKPTEYNILKLVETTGANEKWAIHARNIEAHGTEAAILKSVSEADLSETFVAVPIRNFVPQTLGVKPQEPQLFLS